MSCTPRILAGHSCAADSRTAAREFHAAVAQPEMALVIFFCSSDYDLEALAAEMARLFAGIEVVGCTTAGEIGPAGYRDHSLSGASFPAGTFTVVTGQLDRLWQFEPGMGQAFAQALLRELEAKAPTANAGNSFAFLLIDGLSVREEQVASTLQQALGRTALFGGSAGDGLGFSRTHVYHGGRFHSDSAALILATTTRPFRVFMIQHFVAGEERFVVTGADATRRIVTEINGLPAADEYARLVGVKVGALGPAHFAASPVVVQIDGAYYVRSIQKANPDGSLTFYCAIEEGLVLRMARGVDPVENLAKSFDRIRASIGPPELVLCCDCILRKLESSQSGLNEPTQKILLGNNAVGFSSYGEQFGGVHINQTMTGIAFGQPPEVAHA